MTLKIIGAGFGRTGTESMKFALEQLGFGPCHHMHEVLPKPDLYQRWVAVLDGNDEPDWDTIFAGFSATVDWPSAHYWPELAAHYPDAKIILTVRSTESWLASMEKTILAVVRVAEPESIAHKLGERVFGRVLDDPSALAEIYERNIARTQASFGPDRLLTYELGSGWEPLCAFLGVPVPDTPYPRGNDAKAFHKNKTGADATRTGAE